MICMASLDLSFFFDRIVADSVTDSLIGSYREDCERLEALRQGKIMNLK